MNKKFISLSILFVIIVGGILPQTAAATQTQSQASSGIFDSFRLLKFNTKLSLVINQTDIPTSPLDLNSSLELDVGAWIFVPSEDTIISDHPLLDIIFPFLLLSDEYFHQTYFVLLTYLFPDSLAGRIMFRDKDHGKNVNITLSVESPEWCTVELEKTILNQEFLIKNDNDIKNYTGNTTTKLKVKINEDAPALQTGEIKVTAKFTAQDNWIFTSEENITSFTVMPKYSGNITATIDPLQDVDEYIVPQNESTTFPLNITNNFNGETKVAIDFDDNVSSLNWTISLDQDEIIIPKGETKTVNIMINSSSSKKLEEIQQIFKLTPMSTVDANVSEQYLYGESIEISTGPIIKEKVKEESTFEIDTTLLGLILVVIILAIIVVTIFIKRR